MPYDCYAAGYDNAIYFIFGKNYIEVGLTSTCLFSTAYIKSSSTFALNPLAT